MDAETLKFSQLLGIIVFFVSLLGLLISAYQAASLQGARMFRLAARSALMMILLPLGLGLAAYSAPTSMITVGLPPYAEFSFALDVVGLTMCLVVTSIGAIVTLFSARYMSSEPRQGIFMRWLLMTLVASVTMTVVDSTIVFTLCWIVTSLCLHQLLTFYSENPEAHRCARMKFVISRIGDVGVIGGFFLCADLSGSFSFHALDALKDIDTWKAHLAAVCFALGALTKSAQMPFHIWLPRSLETPTPVSALMHAGIINAGGFLLLRTHPVITNSPIAVSLLILIGTMTAVYGMTCMVTQTSIKKRLAYSTIGQMGFMIVEIGLGFFSAALLHIVGHGCYKACAFLRSGGALEQEREQRFFPQRNIPSWAHIIGGALIIFSGSLISLKVFSLTALPLIVVVISAIVYVLQSIVLSRSWRVATAATTLLIWVGLWYVAGGALLSISAETTGSSSVWQHWQVELSCLIAACLFFCCGVLQLCARKLSHTMRGQQWVIHFHSGLYIDSFMNRLLTLVKGTSV